MSDETGLREVQFRRFGIHEDPEPLMRLHQEALKAAGAYVDNPQLDVDLQSPGDYYDKQRGEFWVGQLKGEIVAMGAFKVHVSPDAEDKEAELKRLRVKPDLQGKGIGTRLLVLLEQRAQRKGYKSLALDVTDAAQQQPARRLYESQGYRIFKRQPAKGGELQLFYYRKQL